mmetsp:Transcript_5387/g.7946  ORF Transcript_5387/g.7946 Transcript_5387/m.7946 type:complete len:509 (+) Transcript_5387:24-1550(+)
MAAREGGLSPRTLLIIFASVQMITYLDRGVISTYLEYIQDSYDLSSLQAGTLAGAYMVGYMIASPIFAHFATKAHPLLLISMGLTFWCIAVVGTGLSLEYGTILLARTATGVGEAAFACLAPPLIDLRAPPAYKSIWMSVFYLFIPVGYAFGYLVAGQWHSSETVKGSLSWRIPFIAMGILISPFIAFIYCKSGDKTLTYKAGMRKDGRRPGSADLTENLITEEHKHSLNANVDDDKPLLKNEENPTPTDEVVDGKIGNREMQELTTGQPSESSAEEATTFLEDLKIVLNNRIFLLVILGYASQTFLVGGFAYWGIKYVEKHLELSESKATLAFGGLTVFTGVVGTATGGLLLDWLRTRATPADCDSAQKFRIGSERALLIMVCCGILSLPCVLLGTAVKSLALFFPMVGLGEILIFMCLTPINTCIVWTTPYQVTPLALALSVLSNHLLGDAISPIIIGALLDSTNNDWRTVFVLLSFWLVWPIVVWVPAWRFARSLRYSGGGGAVV